MNFKRVSAVLLAGVMAASLLTGCGMNKNAVVTKLGSRTVSLGMVNFLARYEQAAMDDLYRTYFGQDVWQQDLYGKGNTMEQETIDDVMDTLHSLYTLSEEDHMAEYGVTVTDEELAQIQEVTDAFFAANTREALNEMGATKELVKEMLRLFTIKSKMHTAVIETVDTTVTDEECNMRGYSVISTGITTHYDSEQGSYVAYTEDEINALTAEMEDIYNLIVAGNTMEEAAEEHGVTVSYKTYDADDDSLNEDLKAALDALSEGEVAPMMITDEYIYIVRLDAETDAEATESNRQSIISTRQSDAFNALIDEWQTDDGWTASINKEQLEKISFKNLFTQEKATEEETADVDGGAATEAGTEAE